MNDRSPAGVGEPFTYIYHRRRWLWLFKALDFLGYRFHRPEPGVPDLSHTRSIMVLKLDQIGDLVLTQPLLSQLKKAAPLARLGLVVGSGRRSVAEIIPEVDDVYELPVRLHPRPSISSLPSFLSGVIRLRRTRPEVIVAAKEDPLTVLLSWVLGAPLRIGFREGGLGYLLTHTRPLPLETPQFAILASLSGLKDVPAPPRLTPREADHQVAQQVLEAFHLPLGLPVVVVHTGSRVPEKQWPQEAFFETMKRMSQEVPIAFLVVRESSDPAATDQNIGLESRSWLGEVPPLELGVFAALLARADLLLGNDSAPAHLAAAVGTPAVVVFLSGEDPRRWGPSGKESELVLGAPGRFPTPDEVARRSVGRLRNQRWASTS
jgi:ADP-heptose:LPS heptosyltransferase